MYHPRLVYFADAVTECDRSPDREPPTKDDPDEHPVFLNIPFPEPSQGSAEQHTGYHQEHALNCALNPVGMQLYPLLGQLHLLIPGLTDLFKNWRLTIDCQSNALEVCATISAKLRLILIL